MIICVVAVARTLSILSHLTFLSVKPDVQLSLHEFYRCTSSGPYGLVAKLVALSIVFFGADDDLSACNVLKSAAGQTEGDFQQGDKVDIRVGPRRTARPDRIF